MPKIITRDEIIKSIKKVSERIANDIDIIVFYDKNRNPILQMNLTDTMIPHLLGYKQYSSEGIFKTKEVSAKRLILEITKGKNAEEYLHDSYIIPDDIQNQMGLARRNNDSSLRSIESLVKLDSFRTLEKLIDGDANFSVIFTDEFWSTQAKSGYSSAAVFLFLYNQEANTLLGLNPSITNEKATYPLFSIMAYNNDSNPYYPNRIFKRSTIIPVASMRTMKAESEGFLVVSRNIANLNWPDTIHGLNKILYKGFDFELAEEMPNSLKKIIYPTLNRKIFDYSANNLSDKILNKVISTEWNILTVEEKGEQLVPLVSKFVNAEGYVKGMNMVFDFSEKLGFKVDSEFFMSNGEEAVNQSLKGNDLELEKLLCVSIKRAYIMDAMSEEKALLKLNGGQELRGDKINIDKSILKVLELDRDKNIALLQNCFSGDILYSDNFNWDKNNLFIDDVTSFGNKKTSYSQALSKYQSVSRKILSGSYFNE